MKAKRKIVSLLLALCMVATVMMSASPALAQTDDTVTITVNYVYESNSAMVAQPYSAIVPTGQLFQQKIAIPQILNYSITKESIDALPAGFALDMEKNLLNINLSAVSGDISVVLYYKAGQAKYTVRHMVQKLGSEEYEQWGDPVTLTGDIGAYTQAEAEQWPGFTSRVEQSEIAADDTTRVDVYYDRILYTIVFDPNGGVNGPEPIYAEYGAEIPDAHYQDHIPTRPGYRFMGWLGSNGETEVSQTVEGNVTYTAQWEAESDRADYTIVIWGQNANDNNYSYLSSHAAYGEPGTEVIWNEDTPICEFVDPHEHTSECYQLICTKPEHVHDDTCGLHCVHQQHDLSCYGLEESDEESKPDEIQEPADGFVSGMFYTYETGLIFKTTHYYLYLDGKWYCHHNGWFGGKTDTDEITLNCTHTHTNACYTCGLEEHTHTDYTGSCYELTCELENHTHTDDCYMSSIHPDRKLWILEKSDTVTINADGSTVLNVYFKRTEFTLTFNYNYSWGSYHSTETITARWGQYIAKEYNQIVKNAGDSAWTTDSSDWQIEYTNYIGIMPKENQTYYLRRESGSGQSTMTYYVENLTGGYDVIFSVTFRGSGYKVTEEDYYEFEGYTIDKDESTQLGLDCDGATFYYNRNSYDLKFFSGNNSNPVKSESVPYKEPLGSHSFDLIIPPEGMESDAVFMGWYLNPECTGEEYILSQHTMPANHVALYAKWVNGLYTVRTFTDATMTTPYRYEGYNGIEKNIIKYTLATAPQAPTKPGEVFVGWFYKDDAGVEKPFSFTMPITKNYNLYPKFSNKEFVNYIVHYYIENSSTKLAEDKIGQARIGSSVSEKAKMGNDLTLANGKQYFPLKTSTSETLNQDGQEIIFYYKEAQETSYTVRYVDALGKDLVAPVTRTTTASVVTERYVEIPGYIPQKYQQTLELSADQAQNIITFVYDSDSVDLELWKKGADQTRDPNTSFLFHIKGTDKNNAIVDLIVSIHGNGSKTITDLPAGSYTVTELTDWSWRYKPALSSQAITLTADGNKQLIFENSRQKDKWLDGNHQCVNRFTGVKS